MADFDAKDGSLKVTFNMYDSDIRGEPFKTQISVTRINYSDDQPDSLNYEKIYALSVKSALSESITKLTIKTDAKSVTIPDKIS